MVDPSQYDDQLANFQRMIRLNNLFGAPQSPSNIQSPQEVVQPQSPSDNQLSDSAMQRFIDLNKPQDVMTRKYQEALDEMPIREKPSWGRRIVGGLIGLGGSPQYVEQAHQYVNQPYLDRLTDWDLRAKHLGEAAKLEQTANVAGARSIIGEEGRDIQRQRLGIDQERNKAKSDIEREKADFQKEKSESIKDMKLQELQQKYDALEQTRQLAQQRIDQQGANNDTVNNLRQATIDAQNARHAAEMAIAQRRLEETQKQHENERQKTDAYVKNLESLIQNRGQGTETTSTELDAEGKPVKSITKSVKKTKGDISLPSTGKTVKMRAPNGDVSDIPSDRVEHYKSLGAVVVQQ